ncbi:MAG: AbrB/MazE/SpoVT family DNA-binding domain-containing protein [Pseudomonadota bacterium]|nr:AbrB/MazE/SpoVT family DNA-binding domain-containing protein [Pseudomonadota bacterium]
MKTEIIRIGNSRGIRIPKAILEECGFNGTVNLEVKNGKLIVSKGRKPREGWEEATRKAIEKHGMPELIWPNDMQDEFDKDWTWPGQKG